MSGKKKYDLICSLGGNCSVAHNLRFRGLRLYSLPFDWCYMDNETPLYKLAECFMNDSFNLIAQKENLIFLPNNENDKFHSNTVHYKDSWSNYYFVNHFCKKIEEGGYDDFSKVLKRRIRRLLDKIETSQNILFILGVNFEIEKSALLYFQSVLNKKYPNKNITIELVEFNCNTNDIICENSNFTIRKYKREQNLYDFTQTNFEWAFLDNIKILPENKNSKLLKITKIKKGLSVNIFSSLLTIIRRQ